MLKKCEYRQTRTKVITTSDALSPASKQNEHDELEKFRDRQKMYADNVAKSYPKFEIGNKVVLQLTDNGSIGW